jgi:hypothetical protein
MDEAIIKLVMPGDVIDMCVATRSAACSTNRQRHREGSQFSCPYRPAFMVAAAHMPDIAAQERDDLGLPRAA